MRKKINTIVPMIASEATTEIVDVVTTVVVVVVVTVVIISTPN